MKITISIMAHPRRTEQANALYKKVAQFPFAAPQIIWDEQNNEWHTGERALAYGIDKGDWHVVLQDDAIINEHFYTNLVKAIENVPDRVLFSLYTGTVRPFNERVGNAVKNANGASWLKGYTLFWGVGIVIPSNHIKPMLDFVKDETDPYDTRIGMFYFRNMLPIFYTNPSLVDHDDDIGTLVGTRSSLPQGRRVARNFIKKDHIWNSDYVDI